MLKNDNISRVIELLSKSNNILFITGAGISADSGLPTYRGIGGLYNNQPVEEGMPVEMALSGEILQSHPEITWKYVYQIEEKCRAARFNRGHQVIAEMENHFERVWTLTQNVDGFHQAAGSQKVINIHGDLHQLLCSHCGWNKRVDDFSSLSIPPVCPECNAIVRPDVVFFGEKLPQHSVKILSLELDKGFDMYFSIGTSSVFPYIIQPILMARRQGKTTIEINPGQSEISDFVDIKINHGAAAALDSIWTQYQKRYLY
ncbi:MAG: NAD-dependent protein deacylase [Candidatus Aminicenantes bacterium]|nr:NAD-dependent protein deacylase [Candidatus Aminicenantes bacterium]